MFSLGQRLLANPSIDLSQFSGKAGMFVKLSPVEGKEKRAVTDLIQKKLPCPVSTTEFTDAAHATVILSKYSLLRSEVLSIRDMVSLCCRSKVFGAAYWPGHDNIGYLVLNVKSDELVNLHDMLVKLGAQHSFRTYEPHITIASSVGPLTQALKDWLLAINASLARKPLPLMLSSLSFSDLWD